jgi:dephospho-CoA kinase
VLSADGALDRPRLAALVFSDDEKRAALNAIVHPLVGQRTAELMAAVPPDAVVVYDVPLLVESNLAGGFDGVVVVEASLDVRLARLAARGMAEADARERMAAQASDEQRRAVADFVVHNDGSVEELKQNVDALWYSITAEAPRG